MANVWSTFTTSNGLSSNVKIRVSMDLTDEQTVEQCKLELHRKINALCRKMSDVQIKEKNDTGEWDITSSSLVSGSTVTVEKSMSTIADAASSGKIANDELDALIAKLQSAKSDA